jgi:hypothetical protein
MKEEGKKTPSAISRLMSFFGGLSQKEAKPEGSVKTINDVY